MVLSGPSPFLGASPRAFLEYLGKNHLKGETQSAGICKGESHLIRDYAIITHLISIYIKIFFKSATEDHCAVIPLWDTLFLSLCGACFALLNKLLPCSLLTEFFPLR